MKVDTVKLINKTSQVTADKVVYELKRQGLLKNNQKTPFQKTETLLYNYNHFKTAIDDKFEQIKEIEQVGLPTKSKDIIKFTGSGGSYKSNADKEEEKIESIENSIQTTKNFIKLIDAAINTLKHDSYFAIIQMKYFDGKTREEMAEYFNVDVSTISRNKNRLINHLQIYLFTDEVIYEMFS